MPMNKSKTRQLNTFILSNTGAEAVENAIKLARYKTKKSNILCNIGSYHGRSNATAACTSSKVIYRKCIGPLMQGVYFFPNPYATQMPISLKDKPKERVQYCLEQVKLLLKQQSSPCETAAVLIEPILGEGGYVIPPPGYLEGLQKICRKNNLLFILDEVQTGFGRTGNFFAYEHFGLEPDIVVMAKGIASGYPLSAIASTKDIMDTQPTLSMGGTYLGNAVSCEAAIATIDTIKTEKLLKNCQEMGKVLLKKLLALQKNFPDKITDVRSIGLMAAIEFDSKVCGKGVADKIVEECSKKRVLLMTSGVFDVIRFVPPLIVTEGDIDRMFEALYESCKFVL